MVYPTMTTTTRTRSRGIERKKSIATAGSAEQIRRKLLMYVTQKKEIELMDSPDMNIHNGRKRGSKNGERKKKRKAPRREGRVLYSSSRERVFPSPPPLNALCMRL